jgi:hypothetical protein
MNITALNYVLINECGFLTLTVCLAILVFTLYLARHSGVWWINFFFNLGVMPLLYVAFFMHDVVTMAIHARWGVNLFFR